MRAIQAACARGEGPVPGYDELDHDPAPPACRRQGGSLYPSRPWQVRVEKNPDTRPFVGLPACVLPCCSHPQVLKHRPRGQNPHDLSGRPFQGTPPANLVPQVPLPGHPAERWLQPPPAPVAAFHGLAGRQGPSALRCSLGPLLFPANIASWGLARRLAPSPQTCPDESAADAGALKKSLAHFTF